MKFNVQNLRQAGFKVRVYHHRRNVANNKTGYVIGQSCKDSIATGGYTTVEITTPDNEILYGRADCSSFDNYNKRIGVAIALGRALNG